MSEEIKKIRTDDWGKLSLVLIDNHEFWCLYDELIDDESGFLHNRRILLEAFKDDNLHGLCVHETDSMYKRDAKNDSIFCKDSCYLLPCLCVKEENKAVIIWTHSRTRKMGFGKKLVELLNIKEAFMPLPDSLGFWKKCNIKI